MNNVKRKFSQVARDISDISDGIQKKTKKKASSQAVQKILSTAANIQKVSPAESQESKSKKNVSAKHKNRKQEKAARKPAQIVYKKKVSQRQSKDVVLNSSPSVPQAKLEKEKPKNGNKIGKTNSMSLAKIPKQSHRTRGESPVSAKEKFENKTSNKDKESNPSASQPPKIFNEKLSKDKLDRYLSYITEKLARPKGASSLINSRHENCFKPAELIVTSSQHSGKHSSSSSLRCSHKSMNSPKSSTHSTASKRSHSSTRRKRSHNTIEIAKHMLSPKPGSPSLGAGQSVPSTSKPVSDDASKINFPPTIILSTHSTNPPEVKTSLHEKASKYKKMKSQTGEELLKFYKDRVDKAIRDKKTFTVCGNFWSVRKALLARGWVEKIHYIYYQQDKDQIRKLMSQSLTELVENVHDKNAGPLYKRVIMSKMLGRHQVDLFWDYGCDPYKLNPDNVKMTIINNIRKGLCSYSTKQGLCELMKRSHWYHYPGLSHIRHPRSYTLTDNGDPDEFIRDFRFTATMSMLKWVLHTGESSIGKVFSDAGKVPIKNFHFALAECDKFIQKVKHQDIDFNIEDAPEFEWNNFLENYYRCVHVGNHFKSCDLETEQSVIHKSKIMLNKMKKVCPCLDMDGYMNIWILKPTAGSRGIGIHICRTLAYVLRVVSERKTIKYVIQKYIERPLLIYNTKFDIRQWFLISCTNPLTIWIYKSCYLRFSSQTYNLRKLHESIHLTNNSVQCKYKNTNRDPALPEFNMWDSVRFKTYLETIGYPNVYDDVIYPGMKECIAAAILIHQDYINTRRNCFELYGADFMLTEDFQPWLIEINSRPALYASTPITGKMCPQVLEDVVKVIIDNARNPNANTGQFELLYKEKQHNLPTSNVSSLQIRGIPLSPEYFYTPPNVNVNNVNNVTFTVSYGDRHTTGNAMLPEQLSSDFVNINNAQNYMKYVSKQMKKTLEKLLEVIQKERERRQRMRCLNKVAVGSARIPMGLKADCIEYVDNITEVNHELIEIQEIFRPKYLSDRKLDDIAQTLEPGISDEVLSLSDGSSASRFVCSETLLQEKTSPKPSKESIQDEMPKETEDELRNHSQKVKDAISTIPETGTSRGYLRDLLRYLNIWNTIPQASDTAKLNANN